MLVNMTNVRIVETLHATSFITALSNLRQRRCSATSLQEGALLIWDYWNGKMAR
jgi:hypothetical protein